ncbi:pectate lyase [Gilvimarinus polysaccharolyticus]|uniref:pectate lyase n=1 Tax=Gilvimarinus polysaccharolyticus TaxID=863921 RepID=UPI0012F99695|nr:pectate lyase [Gilvimarinus polysaccharolyticus]
MIRIRTTVIVLLFTLGACGHQPPVYRPVATDGFTRVLDFWQRSHGDQQVDLYDQNQILAIADNLLLMQRNNGGWPANLNPFRKLTAEQQQIFLQQQNAHDASFANGNIFPQIFYLSHVYLQTGDVRYRDSARKALRLVMSAQLYNGGWSQKVQLAEGGDPTINTRATINALRFLRRVASGEMPYGYVPFDVRRKAADSVRKGDQLLLRLQQAYDSRASIWAAAYELSSSLPTAANAEAVAALDPEVSVIITRYLMQIQRPPAEVVRAVTGAVDWFSRNTLQQVQLRAGGKQQGWLPAYSRVAQPRKALWARQYTISTNQPLVNDASGRLLVPAEINTLMADKDWYGNWARDLLQTDYPRWRRRAIIPPGAPAL